MLSKRLRSLLFTTLLLLLFIVASILLLSHLIKKPSVQHHLLNYLSDALGYEVSIGKIELSLWHGIGVGAKNLAARSRTGTETIIASEVRVGLDVGELIKGRIVPTKIFLFQPKIELTIGQESQSSKPGQASSYKEILGRRLTLLPSISLHEARIVIKRFLDIYGRNFEIPLNLPYISGPLDTDPCLLRPRQWHQLFHPPPGSDRIPQIRLGEVSDFMDSSALAFKSCSWVWIIVIF